MHQQDVVEESLKVKHMMVAGSDMGNGEGEGEGERK